MNNDLMFSSANQAWDTPQDFYDKLNEEFKFTIDLAASKKSAKHERFYTEEDNAFTKDWGGETGWLNPPYGRTLGKWVGYTAKESKKPNTTIVMLIPARTDTQYFHIHIWNKEKHTWREGVKGRFIPGRLTFGSNAYWEWVYTQEYLNEKKNTLFGNTKGKRNAAPFPSLLAIFSSKK